MTKTTKSKKTGKIEGSESPAEAVERIGVLVVHGVGEQRHYEHLEGIAADEERTVAHTFPDDYANESWQGRPASFHFKCKEVKSRLVPEWTDDLAQTMGDYEGLLDLRIKVRESLTESAERDAAADYAEQVIKALQEGWIAGAGLDVFEKEPLPPDSPLYDLDNVILSPHVAGFSPYYDERASDLFAENLHRYLAGEELLNLVDKGAGY